MDNAFYFGIDLHAFFHILILVLLLAALFFVTMRFIKHAGWGAHAASRSGRHDNDHSKWADQDGASQNTNDPTQGKGS